ncbi:MAG: hypothetical protein IJF83_01445 [Methanobrevibacter sp.]|nr:hypothetical protein [Methanobrevibacter sp.]
MNFEFSFVALLLLIMLFVPNILWSRCPPKDYEKHSKNENRILLALERIGEILVVVFSLFCGVNFSLNLFLILVFAVMLIYEAYWVRYFTGSKTMHDMYESFCHVPLPGATLPVFSFLLLGFCANDVLLILSSLVLGIGHIGIHYFHNAEL